VAKEGDGLQQGKARPATSRARRRIGVLGVSLAALVVPAPAPAEVINFDELSAPAREAGVRGRIVNVEYANKGVTFPNNIEVFNYSTSGLARSQPNAAEPPCFAADPFCQGPITATFTTGQDRVRLFAGYSHTSGPPKARLLAFDAETGGNQIAAAEAQIPTAPAPAATELVVDPPGSQIRRVELTTEGNPPSTGSLMMDDFEFSNVGPPPPCNANSTPFINLSQPTNGETVQNNLFPLRGQVFANGAPITSATLELITPTQKTRSIYPGLIDGDGGQFAATVGQLLEPGKNTIRVTATNCAGTGTSLAYEVNFNPVPAGARFNLLGPIEVNQAVQAPNNDVRLIAADGTNFKRTFARVYLDLQGATRIDKVTGTLTAFRPDGSRPDGPVLVDSLNSVSVRETNTLENVRSNQTSTTPSDLTSSLNFELPSEWLTAGRLHIELTGLKVEGQNLNIPCDGCANPNASGLPDIIRFHQVPPVRLWTFRVPYQATPTSTIFTPAQTHVDRLVSWLERAYPTAEVQNTTMLIGTQDDDPEVRDTNDKIVQEGFTCEDIWDELSDFMATQPAQHAATRYYGLVDDGGGFMRGCAQIGGTFGSGPAGCCWPWEADGTYADWYGGHEIGHMYDRRHPGFCDDQGEDDGDFPYAGGLIGDASRDFQGLDPGDQGLPAPMPGMALYDWRDAWADVMTYCDNQWISNYTYRGILSNLCEGDTGNCPDRDEITRSARRRAKGGKNKPTLSVAGELNLDSNRLKLGAIAAGRGMALTPRPKKSNYEIVLRGPGRDRSYPFEPKELSDLPAGREVATFNEVVRFDKRARAIAVEEGGRELAAQKISRSSPSVRLGKVKKKGDEVKVRWRSRDRDGGKRTHSVLYSSDGKEYLPVAAGLKGRSYTVDLSALPGGKKARIRVVANDGVLTGSATSKAFGVPVKAPEVSILSPAPGQAFDSDDQVQLTADVRDLQDRQFAAKDIVWRSNLQGELGTGPSLLTRLDAGSHEITATATNSGRKSGSASLRVEVEAVPPVFDAS
jgi:hypothetical protein